MADDRGKSVVALQRQAAAIFRCEGVMVSDGFSILLILWNSVTQDLKTIERK